MNNCNRNKPCHLAIYLIGILMISCPALAEWNIVIHKDTELNTKTNVAYTKNKSGYILEIYRDSVDAIRSRLTMADGLLQLKDKSCPTFQVDRGIPINRSINNAPCLTNRRWAEYILGYIKDDEVKSSVLFALMYGYVITYRFQLEYGDYRETKFSLGGSKRALKTVVGNTIRVTPLPAKP